MSHHGQTPAEQNPSVFTQYFNPHRQLPTSPEESREFFLILHHTCDYKPEQLRFDMLKRLSAHPPSVTGRCDSTTKVVSPPPQQNINDIDPVAALTAELNTTFIDIPELIDLEEGFEGVEQLQNAMEPPQ
jgi:hypothetical protein